MKLEDTYHFQQVNRKYSALLELIVREYGLGTRSFSAEHGGYQYAAVVVPVVVVEHSIVVFVGVGLAVAVAVAVVVGEQFRLSLQSLPDAVTH